MIRLLVATGLVFLLACASPPSPDTKVILGATLVSGSEPPLEHAVIIVKEDRIAAVGTQQMIPIPPGSEKVEAYGKVVTAAEQGGVVQAGSSADLVVLSGPPDRGGKVERRMSKGRWIP